MVDAKNPITLMVSLLAAAVLCGAGPVASSAPASSMPSGARQKPNFIFILTDDLDAKSVDLMPRIKKLLMNHGTIFSNFFVTDSLCCPSRASFLRGQYPHNHQVLSNAEPEGGFERFHELGHEQSTIATWLKAAGYRTVLLGKYLNGYPGKQSLSAPPGWDEWYALKDPRKYFGYRINENGRLVSYGHDANEYQTDVLAAKTVDFIARTTANGKQPFFIYLAPSAPHTPATPAPRHEEDFPHATAPRTPAFNESDVSGKPAWLRNAPPLSSKGIAEIDQLYRKRLQSMLAVDEMIEKIVVALQTHGVLDQTYIFFTSDNGFHFGEHRLKAGKDTAYEEDIRVPLIVRGPGVPAGRTLQHLALNIDIAPTLVELAGTRAPSFVDGQSLRRLLTQAPPSARAWREDFVVEHWSHLARGMPTYEALRTKDYLYVEYTTGERELYDLRVDPDELRNIVNSVNAGVVTHLSKRLGELKHCVADNCRQHSPKLL
jgi:N-acetylglucosamine-6-sulfatase